MVPQNIKPELKSKIEPSSLDDFVSMVEMSNKQFEVERYQKVVEGPTEIVRGGGQSLMGAFEGSKNPQYTSLQIP